MSRTRFSSFLAVCALLTAVAVEAAEVEVKKFAPIPVYAIYPPLKSNGSADDALSTGRVFDELYPMALPAEKRWRIAYQSDRE